MTSKRFHSFVLLATFSKFLLNVIRRLIYPFATEFARGTGVPLSAITPVIALNQATSILGPVGASFADRYGYKKITLFALVLLILGSLLAGVVPLYPALAGCFFLAGVAKSLYDPSLQALIGDLVSYEQRGRFIGIMEMAWAGSTLVGIPLAGMIIARFSWQTPFLIISLFTFVNLLGMFWLMPKDRTSPKKHATAQFIANWKIVIKNPRVLGIMGFSFFMALGSDNLFIVYGGWLEQFYGLSLAEIGLGTILIGLAEILGETGTALFSDRIGLRRSIFFGGCLCCLAYLMLPVLDRGVPLVLAGLFLVFLTFEFTYVTSMGLATELVPELRASTMSAFYAVAGMGRVVGAFMGSMVWSESGILPIALISGTCTLAALCCILAASRFSR